MHKNYKLLMVFLLSAAVVSAQTTAVSFESIAYKVDEPVSISKPTLSREALITKYNPDIYFTLEHYNTDVCYPNCFSIFDFRNPTAYPIKLKDIEVEFYVNIESNRPSKAVKEHRLYLLKDVINTTFCAPWLKCDVCDKKSGRCYNVKEIKDVEHLIDDTMVVAPYSTVKIKLKAVKSKPEYVEWMPIYKVDSGKVGNVGAEAVISRQIRWDGYGIGHACTANGECESGYCGNGYCTTGENCVSECNANNQCITGSCDYLGYCDDGLEWYSAWDSSSCLSGTYMITGKDGNQLCSTFGDWSPCSADYDCYGSGICTDTIYATTSYGCDAYDSWYCQPTPYEGLSAGSDHDCGADLSPPSGLKLGCGYCVYRTLGAQCINWCDCDSGSCNNGICNCMIASDCSSGFCGWNSGGSSGGECTDGSDGEQCYVMNQVPASQQCDNGYCSQVSLMCTSGITCTDSCDDEAQPIADQCAAGFCGTNHLCGVEASGYCSSDGDCQSGSCIDNECIGGCPTTTTTSTTSTTTSSTTTTLPPTTSSSTTSSTSTSTTSSTTTSSTTTSTTNPFQDTADDVGGIASSIGGFGNTFLGTLMELVAIAVFLYFIMMFFGLFLKWAGKIL